MSYEWRISPFTKKLSFYLADDLSVIGLPATEANNSLSIALIGHEIGHAIWNATGDKNLAKWKRDINKELYSHIATAIDTRFDRLRKLNSLFTGKDLDIIKNNAKIGNSQFPAGTDPHFSNAYSWAQSHLEEFFSDCTGIYLFGEAYLLSFAYYTAPNLGKERSLRYPSLDRRIENMRKVAAELPLAIPGGYRDMFTPCKDPTGLNKVLLEISEEATDNCIGEIRKKAKALCSERGFPDWEEKNIQEVIRSFKKLLPANQPVSLSNILVAGWRAILDEDFYDESLLKNRIKRTKERVINELILKSAEVLEYRARLNQDA